MTLASEGGGPWLVTGATGFLGRHLLEAIGLEAPHRKVVVVLREPAAWPGESWTAPLTYVRTLAGDLWDGDRWAADPAVAGANGLFHCAAVVKHRPEDAAEMHRVNVEGTCAMVRIAARLRCRMVYVSTSGVVGCFRERGKSADENAPYCADEVAAWPYYRSKVEAERKARALAAELGVDLVIVRPPVLLGPGDHRYRSLGHILRYLDGHLPFIIHGGMHFADIRDVATALVRAMSLPAARPVYHLPGTVCTVGEFYGMVAEVAGGRPPRIELPPRIARLVSVVGTRLGLPVPAPMLIDMATHFWAMHSLYASDELGYVSRPPRETLRDAVVWLREHPPLTSRRH